VSGLSKGLKLEKSDIIDFAHSIGIDLIGFTAAVRLSKEHLLYKKWIDGKYHADMAYLAANTDKRFDPGLHIEHAKTVIAVGVSYNTGRAPGIISRYACGKDYHAVMKHKLKLLEGSIKKAHPELKAKACVDSAVLSEKSIGAKAGLGWIGKNSLLMNERYGSWFFLGELIMDIEYEPDAPVKGRCSNCRKCIDACPTGAINDDRTINASRCISYLTIEDKSAGYGSGRKYAYGCDICQEACPFNSNARNTQESEFISHNVLYKMTPEELKALSPQGFAQLSSGTALSRIKYKKFVDNLLSC